ncbi:hypothetical protein [Arthrobacter flavus]|uniref:Uncharacterized protein n=1 Tax=Arthrobacter flavus TaxID=95172 RepID=A0ABW4Q4C1_9MICC
MRWLPGLSAGDALPDAVRVAVLVGAYAVGAQGAQPSYPSLENPLPAAPASLITTGQDTDA